LSTGSDGFTGNTVAAAPGATLTVAYLNTLPRGTLVKAQGDVTISGSASLTNNVTVYAPNGNISIVGNIPYAGGNLNRSSLPGLGIIARDNIYIERSTTRVDGYLFADGVGLPGNGKIVTCASGFSAITFTDANPNPVTRANNIKAKIASCNSDLVVNGLLMANSFNFNRTGSTGGYSASETVNYLGQLYLAPPPAFVDTISSNARAIQFNGEKPPLY
jgi:adhesin HecA-like repeat protein